MKKIFFNTFVMYTFLYVIFPIGILDAGYKLWRFILYRRFIVSRTKIGYDAVESLYNQIMFGMYYSILSSIILILLIRKYYKK